MKNKLWAILSILAIIFAAIATPAAPVSGASPARSIVGDQLGPQANASISLIVRYEANNVMDPWKIYDPRAPDYANDLWRLEAGKGYWVKSRAEFDLQLSGWQNPIYFSVGWNLIGWLAVATPTPAPTKTPAPPTPTPTPEPNIADYVFGTSVSLAERERIVKATQDIVNYAVIQGTGAGQIKVYAGATDELIKFYSEAIGSPPEETRRLIENVIGRAGAKSIFLNISKYIGVDRDPVWQTREIYRVVAHEYFHLIQEKLRGRHLLEYEPTWLGEGGSEYFAFKVLDYYGIRTWAEALAERRAAARQISAPLSSLEDGELGAYDNYALPFVAVNLLAERAGGLPSLVTFWREENQFSWQEAFEKTFRITVEQFYTDFEAHRSQI